jgi:hypothetical protein
VKSAEHWVKQCPNDAVEFVRQIQLDAYKDGMDEACKVIQQRADDYDAEHGHTDLETGTREYPKNGDEYMLELTEIIESIAETRDNKTTI